MVRFGLAVLSFAALSSAAGAEEWRPFGDLPNYVVRSAGTGGSAGFGLPSLQGLGAGKFPAIMSGGSQPAIAPSAPPVVNFPNDYGTGTIVVDTAGRALYYVLSGASAYRYPISVGREGFTWSGTERISRVADWPDWRPPAQMRQRDPRLPELMHGGVNNPLGAKALYLGASLYRIHGTNDTRSIGYAASSGCFRMMNAHVIHLSTLARIGTKVMVMRSLPAANRRLADITEPRRTM